MDRRFVSTSKMKRPAIAVDLRAESGDSILYFFRTRFPVTSNLDYTAPHHSTPHCCFPHRIRRRPKLYSVCSSPGALARLRFFRLLFAEVFHEDCGVPGRNLKWMPVSAPRYGIGDFSLFFFLPLSHRTLATRRSYLPARLTEICSRKLLFRGGAFWLPP